MIGQQTEQTLMLGNVKFILYEMLVAYIIFAWNENSQIMFNGL